MAKFTILAGTTSYDVNLFIQNSSLTTGAGLTGLTSASASLTAYYHRQGAAAATAITLADKTIGTYAVGGFAAVDGTNMPGLYELSVPNTALAAGAKWVNIMLKGATNMAPVVAEIELTVFDNQATTAGLTNVSGNVVQWNGTNVSSPATAGIPEVNVKNINNVATTSVTTINANQGTTQPVNFTGTGASALTKSDMVDVAGAAVSTTTAQLGVNAVNIGGTAQTGRDIGASVLLSSGTGTGQLDFTSGVVKANLAQILGTALTETAGLLAGGFKKFFNVATPTGTLNSIPDAVAGAAGGLMIAGSNAATTVNITGNITGNLSGSVGSVTGAVGSVTAGVTVTTNNDKTGYGLSAAAVQAIWDALTSALTAVGSIGKLLVTDIDATISSRTKPADTQARVTLVDTVTTYTGDTPQTGDSFARIGAAGASLTSVGLAATGLDSITATRPAGVATTFPQMLVQLFYRFFGKSTLTSTQLKTYAANGSTVVTTQTVSDDTVTQTQGEAS